MLSKPRHQNESAGVYIVYSVQNISTCECCIANGIILYLLKNIMYDLCDGVEMERGYIC